jgi:glycosyltransferase involved in cell wall biosynthesis
VKNQAMLLRAAIPLCAAYPSLHVLLIGEGPARADLEAQTLMSGLGDRVHFAGTLPNTPNPHGLLDISVLASRTEGSPNSILEAMAAGCPVVATDVGGTPEVVMGHCTGLLVRSEDELSLTRALQQMIDSPEQRGAFGAAGRERARTQYHVDAVIGRLSDWYASLLFRS